MEIKETLISFFKEIALPELNTIKAEQVRIN